MRLSFRHVCLVYVVLSPMCASAQVSTGTPLFSSIGGGPFDAINLGNLNAHFQIPILHKAGRGIPFTYDLAYDSSVWVPVTSSGVTQWQPVGNWGWTAQTAATTGYVKANYSSSKSGPPTCSTTTQTWSNYTYFDPIGRAHPFPGITTISLTFCNNRVTSTNSGPLIAAATDGSGYNINTGGAGTSNWTITSAGGAVITGPYNSQNGVGTYTDANGNQVSVNSSGQYFDTLSSITPVLTMGGAGSPSNPTTFTYTPPTGPNVFVQVNYTQYTVATNFGFTASPQIQEYGPQSVSLVSSIVYPDGGSYQFQYEKTPGSCAPLPQTYPSNCVTGRIYQVTLPTGGKIRYSYSGGPTGEGIFADGSTATLSRELSPGGTWTYSRSLVSGTAGPGSTWTTTISDPSSPSNITLVNFAEDSTTNTNTTTATYNLYETQRQIYQGANSPGNLRETIVRCYNGNYANCSTATVGSSITRTDTYTQLLNGTTKLSEVSYAGPEITSVKDYDFGVTQGSSPGTSHLIRAIYMQYANLGNGIVNKPSNITVSDWSSGSAVTLSSTSYSYDQTAVQATSGTPQHIAISGSRGNLTTSATQANSGTILYQTFSYFDTGNLYQSTGLSTSSTSPGPTTTYNYDSTSCGNSFVTSLNEPLSLSRSTQWDCTGGVVKQTTDENSQIVKTNYTDPVYWRPANVYDQENNETTIAYSGLISAEGTLSFNGSGQSVIDWRSTLDGFGRPILFQQLQGPGSTNYNTYETDYNDIGQPSRATMPFSALAGATSETAPGMTAQYDALGRPAEIQDANGGKVSYSYANNDVLQTVSGSQSFKKQLEYDGLGRLTSVCEITSTLSGRGTCGQSSPQTGYWTKYIYDALRRFLSLTPTAPASSGQQTRSYSYDMLGRLTRETNPENGTVNYTYDSISPCADGTNYSYPGNLVQRTDNSNNSICYAYDSLNRPTKAGNSAAANTILREFVYDSESSYPTGVSVNYGKTRIVEAKTVNTSNLSAVVTDEFFSYSPRGELTDVYESTPHSGGFYHTTAAYWPSGALQTLSGIPSVPTLYYGASNSGGSGLDGQGRYTKVTAGSGTDPISSVTYSTSTTSNPLGALIGVTYGSSDSDSFTFDPNTGIQTGYAFTVNGAADTGTLRWNTNGTLASLAIADTISGTSDSQSCTFTYDDLGRVGGTDSNGWSADCGSGKWQQAFTYDAFGNISKTSSGGGSFGPTYNSANNHFTLSGVNVQYDGNGNLTADNLNTYSWDPLWGNVVSVNGNSAVYDALGRVVEQGIGSGYTEILWSPVGKVALMNGGSLSKAFIGFPGGGTAIYNSSGLAYYRHSDWLGSSRLTSTQARGFYSSAAYAPFGEQYSSSGTPDSSFTGEDSDTVLSLYDFTFRRLSPSQGRWISPDPAGASAADPTSPQSFNRYSYVQNTPLAFVDPFGLNRLGPGECDASVVICDNGGGDTFDGDPLTYSLDFGSYDDPWFTVPASFAMGVLNAGFGYLSAGEDENEQPLSFSAFGPVLFPGPNHGNDTPNGCSALPGFAQFQTAAQSVISAYPQNSYTPAWLRGIVIHTAFSGIVSAFPNTSVNVSYKNGLVAGWLDFGSVRPDAVYGNVNAPNFVIELKTGGARLQEPQLSNYMLNLPNNTPICEIYESAK